MLLFYIRHGDPIYDPDSLTPLGQAQAEAVMHRLCVHGIDEIYASSSNRAILTATPSAKILKKEIQVLDWCNEAHCWNQVSMVDDTGFRTWSFSIPKFQKIFNSEEMRSLGSKWYDHKVFEGTTVKEGAFRIQKETDEFLQSLGYRHDRNAGIYYPENHNDKRIALFAHEGFGASFFSALLDIPYPLYATHFTMCHSGMSVIEFTPNKDGFVIPKVLQLSNDSHIFAKGLPLRYNNSINI